MSQHSAGRVRRHATHVVARVENEPPIRVGAPVRVAVDVTCRDGCDLGGAALSVSEPDGPTRAIAIRDGRIDVATPTTPGMHTWTIALAERIDGDVVHAAWMQSFTIDVQPHRASLAVWSAPDAVISGQPFAVKVGANSTGGFVLAGQGIVVCNEAGEEAGRAVLGREKWPGTEALHWVEVALNAPTEQGVSSWTAALDTTALALPHVAYPCDFTVPVTDVPGHRITVTIVDKATGAPLDEAIVRVGAFRATTDANGCATLHVPRGVAQIVVWKAGFDVPDAEIDVQADADVRVDAKGVREEDPDARWRG